MPVTIYCKLCGSGFDVKPSHADKRVYCSMKCMSEAYRGKRRILNCKTCGESFEVPDKPSRKNAKFCSKKCMGKGQEGKKHWNYKHGQKWLPEVKREYFRKYYEQNKEAAHERAFLGKVKRRQANPKGSHTFKEWIELLVKHDNKCFYCGVRMTKKAGLRQRTRDHIVPISKGGSDDISNIVPACRSCNSSKSTKTLEEWKGVTVIETTSTDGRE